MSATSAGSAGPSDARGGLAPKGPVVSSGKDRYAGRRQHVANPLPVIDPQRSPPEDVEVLLAVYAEVCSNWRQLTEVRFKLLALLPPIAAIGLVGVVSREGPTAGLSVAARIGLACFGLLVTLGLYVYDKRNNTLYDDLVSRARRAEYELGVHTGAFLGRVKPKQTVRSLIFVKHNVATRLVYFTVMGSWVAAIVLVLFDS